MTATYEELTTGQALPELRKGPVTGLHLMRWSAAIENWHRIHYDIEFAKDHEGLPDLPVQGTWKQHIIHQMLKDWVGPAGWVTAIKYQYRALDLRNDTITAGGEVTDLYIAHGLGYVNATIWIKNQRGVTSTTGEATVVLPLRDGPPVPYPFPQASST